MGIAVHSRGTPARHRASRTLRTHRALRADIAFLSDNLLEVNGLTRARRTLATVGVLCTIGVPGILLAPLAHADYATPGLGESYTLTDLVSLSGGVVTGLDPQFVFNASVIVSATDTLTLAPGTTVTFADVTGASELEIHGALLAFGAEGDSIRFTSQNQGPGDYAGLSYRDTAAGSDFQLHFALIEYADTGVEVFGASATVVDCLIRYTGAKAIGLGQSNSVVRHCRIQDNVQQTITMTLSSSPLIEDNIITGNNIEDAHPYPFINIGLQGVNSPTIRGNTIIGGSHLSGGIAIWNSCNGLIESNTIENCGYGILCYQVDADPLIRNNVLLNNNIHPDTVNWGFGIACNGANEPVISGNSIQGHYYGVAMINGAQPDVGDLTNGSPDDDGGNRFLGNGLAGNLYELYNNTGLDIMAQNNWWGTDDPQQVEDRIVHAVDNPALGTVTFEPFLAADPVAVRDGSGQPPAQLALVPAYPNPFNPRTNLTFTLASTGRAQVNIYDAAGRRLSRLLNQELPAGSHHLVWDGTTDAGRSLPSGIYFYRISLGSEQRAGKLVLVR